jgi:peptidoglycan/LPS O-acetylase OafA/YrhL
MSGQPRTTFVRAAMWLDTYAIIGLVLVSTCGRAEPGRAVRVLADATFAIYLFHLFFIHAAELFILPARHEFDLVAVATYWCAGLFGALGLVALARAVLGARSRDVIGA